MAGIGRRTFLKAAGAMGLTTVTAGQLLAQETPVPTPHDMGEMTPAVMGEMNSWQEMDAHHQKTMDKFLANVGQDPTFWGEEMPFEMDGEVKVYRMVCQEIDWVVEDGLIAKAMAYNGRVPGPEVRVTEGDRVRFIVTNEMSQSTAVHWHGLMIPNEMDGVPMITQPVITPGSTFSYEFTIRNAGTHMYHSHHNSAEQVSRGLLGPFIVMPKDTSREPKVDAEYNFVLNDSGLGTFTINGKSFPYTQPIIAKKGQKIRVRYFNEGFMIHPMHLHGMPQLVFAKDGFHLPMPYMCDTVNIAPGERYDVLIDCTELGTWAYHCHILTHAEGPSGMFGMVTVLIVQE